MAAPRYYCPPGVDRPAHIAAVAPNALVDGAGPLGLGGCTYGGAWEGPPRAWHAAPGGWWVSLDDVAPRDLLRTDARSGHLVDGWVVPAIVGVDGCALHGYWTAEGFRLPEGDVELVERLRGVLDLSGPITITAELAQLAVAVLARNYRVTLVELGILRVATPSWVWRSLKAACGVPPDYEVPGG